MKKKNVTKLMSLFLAFVTASFSAFASVPPVLAAEENTVAVESSWEDDGQEELQDFSDLDFTEETDVADIPEDLEESSNSVIIEDSDTTDSPEDEQEDLPAEETEQVIGSGSGLTDFTSPTDDLIIDEDSHAVTLINTGGDHFAVYNGLESEVNSFTLEADVFFKQGQDINSAALIFGLSSKTAPGVHWNGANVDSGRLGNADAFRMFGPDVGGEIACGNGADVDFTLPVHFKMQVNEKGEFTYSYGNNDKTPSSKSGKLASWTGGYVGLLTWNSEATFTNISFEGEYVESGGENTSLDADERYKTNLTGLVSTSGVWEVTDEGLHSNAVGLGDSFLYSESFAGDFVFSTNVKFLSDGGAASLLFRSGSSNSNRNSYAVNFDIGNKAGKFWRWVDGRDMVLGNEKPGPVSDDGTYNLKVVAIGSWVSFYVNDTLLASSGDYTLQPDDRGQDTCAFDGYLGLLNFNGEMVFQNTFFTPIEGAFDPRLEDITVSSSGTVEKKAQFTPGEPIFIQYVENDASSVDIITTPMSSGTDVNVIGPDGETYADGKGVPVSVGVNYITVVSTSTSDDGTTASLTYRVNVHRRQPDAIYYNEPYRDQYHYSVKDGWANDPNGLVYYNGTYHFFYQFYDAKQWGPMHWAHVTSTDLIHWEEQPIAFYPDANGAMFSGCIVIDDNNTSGLFSSPEGGLVALITCDGNGQRIKLAYSEDEGCTWTKVDNIAADWTRDPLGTDAFRDPKVFRWENKWFMVLAGGPLRIYSSDDLLTWTCEATYADLHTECPDLYPIEASDGAVKWVLSRGGRFYKVGDFTEVNGKWRFVPDSEYTDRDGVMNFGKDSYAAMTFYVQDFGTAANPTLPDILEINWMNTWDDYCNAVANKVGQDFNGTFNLVLKEGLIEENGTYLLTQTPVDEYESLRGDAVIDLKGAEVTPDNDILDSFAGDCYEIVSTFYPGSDTTKVGFKLRVSEDESTDVIYDLNSQTLSIDRSRSGIQISKRFTDVDSQQVSPNDDGSVTLHIYMDKASIEVFTKDDTAAGGNQIFPSADSLGAKVIAEGGTATADITIYPMDSIWDKTTSDIPLVITSGTEDEIFMYAGDKKTIRVTLLPTNVAQDVDWTVEDSSVVSMQVKGAAATVTALKKGTTTVTATSTAVPELTKSFTIQVLENNFETNLEDWKAVNGTWVVDDKTLSCSNVGSNDFYMSAKPIDFEEFVLETKVAYTRGLINIFFATNSTDPFDRQAYAIQVGDSPNVRLFRFAGDTIAEGSMGKTINDGQYHDVKITKTVDNICIEIDGTECLDRKMENVESFFNTKPYAGIGLWDGAVDVQTFYVNELKPEPKSISKASVSGISRSYGYSGKEYTPAITVTLDGEMLIEGTDYTVKYENNKNPGTAKITVTGIGNYKDTRVRTFEIVDCVSTIKSGKTYLMIPKNNSSTAVCSFAGRMVNNTKVYITDRSNSEAMRFKAVKNSDGTWKFINAKCELALAVQQNSPLVGKGLVLYEQTTRQAQNWKLSKRSDNSFAIMNSVTGYSIAMSDSSAVKGTTLSMAETASNGLQRFYFVETDAVKTPFDGTYAVKASANKKFALNIASSSKEDGANVNLYTYSNTNVKKFKVMYSGGGFYRLVNVNSGLCVTVKGNSTYNGANVIQSKWAAENGQRWKIKKNSDGTVTFTNALGTVLHLVSNQTVNNKNVVAKTAASTKAQKWYLE